MIGSEAYNARVYDRYRLGDRALSRHPADPMRPPIRGALETDESPKATSPAPRATAPQKNSHALGSGANPDTGDTLQIYVPCRSRYLDLHRIHDDRIGARMRLGKDLVAAAATPVVLGILAEGESYGYAILQRIVELSGGELEWSDGMLYPLLHRLERLGHVDSEWRQSPGGRARKHYRLSVQGASTLADQRRQWSVVGGVLDKVWPGGPDDRQPRLALGLG